MEEVFGNHIHRNGKLNAKVLLLNQSYEPLTICTVKKALILLFLEKAELVSQRQDVFINSVNHKFPWPSVIRLSNFIRVPYKKIILTRKNILKRDNHKCSYCGRGDLPLTVDHVIPRARGGEDTWENLVAACLPCNNKKGNRTPEEANMKMKLHPFKPDHISYIKSSAGRLDKEWKPFLFH